MDLFENGYYDEDRNCMHCGIKVTIKDMKKKALKSKLGAEQIKTIEFWSYSTYCYHNTLSIRISSLRTGIFISRIISLFVKLNHCSTLLIANHLLANHF